MEFPVTPRLCHSPSLMSRQSIDCSPLSRDHWVDLLSISSRYDFDDIRERAIKEITGFSPPLEPVRMLELAIHYDVPKWLESSYCALCQRPQSMSESEVNRVGVNIALKISKARDVLHRSLDGEFRQQRPGQRGRWGRQWE